MLNIDSMRLCLLGTSPRERVRNRVVCSRDVPEAYLDTLLALHGCDGVIEASKEVDVCRSRALHITPIVLLEQTLASRLISEPDRVCREKKPSKRAAIPSSLSRHTLSPL